MQLEILMRKDTNGLFLKMKRTGIVAWVRMTIGLNFQTELFLNTSVFWAYTRVLHKALENISNEYMGFQSVLYNPTLDVAYGYNRAPCVLDQVHMP